MDACHGCNGMAEIQRLLRPDVQLHDESELSSKFFTHFATHLRLSQLKNTPVVNINILTHSEHINILSCDLRLKWL